MSEQMDVSAVRAIQDTAREAERNIKAAAFIPTPNPRKQLLLHADKHEEFVVPPPARSHKVYTLVDLIAYAKGGVEEKTKGSLWYGPAGATLLIDDADRRDRVTFSLVLSDTWLRLAKLDGGDNALQPKDLIRLLRTHLGASEATVAVFRKLDFQTMIKNSSNVSKNRESMGNSIEAEVQGTSDLPEELFVEVPIYCTAGEKQTYRVRLLLEYDPQAGRIIVCPKPDLLEDLVDRHQADIRARLDAELADVLPIYYGSP